MSVLYSCSEGDTKNEAGKESKRTMYIYVHHIVGFQAWKQDVEQNTSLINVHESVSHHDEYHALFSLFSQQTKT